MKYIILIFDQKSCIRIFDQHRKGFEDDFIRNCQYGYIQRGNQCFSNLGDIEQYDTNHQLYPICYPGQSQDKQCFPIFGYDLINGLEECDDGNSIPYDGCYNQKFSCNQNCYICKFGVCQKCQKGYDLYENDCFPVCGNARLVPYLEECDDGNQKQGDGCYNCHYECCPECIDCKQQFCIKCNQGYLLDQNQCQPICGDKLVLSGTEECDDGNEIQYDGCYNCEYSCYENCKNCDQGICQDECQNGYRIVNNQCQSICGDMFITINEQCEDDNDMEYDGCYNCKYSCPLNCQYCEKGQCLSCEINYQLSNNLCTFISICGNKKVEGDEECDDGNTLANDGCYECMFELDWLEQKSSSLPPQMILTFLNQTYSLYYVGLTFSQQILINDNYTLDEFMELGIQNFDQSYYKIQIFIENVDKLQYINLLYNS